jgi:hypothetical protein
MLRTAQHSTAQPQRQEEADHSTAPTAGTAQLQRQEEADQSTAPTAGTAQPQRHEMCVAAHFTSFKSQA